MSPAPYACLFVALLPGRLRAKQLRPAGSSTKLQLALSWAIARAAPVPLTLISAMGGDRTRLAFATALRPKIANHASVRWKVLEGFQTIEMVDRQVRYRLGRCQANVDGHPAATILA